MNFELLKVQISVMAYTVANGITTQPTIKSAHAKLIINKFPTYFLT
jgi:hypothetical protein